MTGRVFRPFPAPWRSRCVASCSVRGFYSLPCLGDCHSTKQACAHCLVADAFSAVLQTEKAFQKQLGVNTG